MLSIFLFFFSVSHFVPEYDHLCWKCLFYARECVLRFFLWSFRCAYSRLQELIGTLRPRIFGYLSLSSSLPTSVLVFSILAMIVRSFRVCDMLLTFPFIVIVFDITRVLWTLSSLVVLMCFSNSWFCDEWSVTPPFVTPLTQCPEQGPVRYCK